MLQEKDKVTEATVSKASGCARLYSANRLEKAVRFATDNLKSRRTEQQECRYCFYLHSERIGGRAITTGECGICGEIMMFNFTCTDAVCPECATKYQLCKHCGGDIDMRVKRKALIE
jgi:hypothetical protein